MKNVCVVCGREFESSHKSMCSRKCTGQKEMPKASKPSAFLLSPIAGRYRQFGKSLTSAFLIRFDYFSSVIVVLRMFVEAFNRFADVISVVVFLVEPTHISNLLLLCVLGSLLITIQEF